MFNSYEEITKFYNDKISKFEKESRKEMNDQIKILREKCKHPRTKRETWVNYHQREEEWEDVCVVCGKTVNCG